MRYDSHLWLSELSKGQTRHYVKGDIVFRPDKTENRFFIMQTGLARIFLCTDNKELTIGYLRENSLYVTHTRAWIEAMSEVQITSWPLSQLKNLMTVRPEFAIASMQEIGGMLHNTIDIIEDLAFRSVESRFARYLLTEYHQQKSTTIEVMGNTEILASLLGTSRQTLSTLMNRMLKDKVLERVDRRYLVLVDIPYLENLVAGMSAS